MTMKKLIGMMLTVVMVLGTVACGNPQTVIDLEPDQVVEHVPQQDLKENIEIKDLDSKENEKPETETLKEKVKSEASKAEKAVDKASEEAKKAEMKKEISASKEAQSSSKTAAANAAKTETQKQTAVNTAKAKQEEVVTAKTETKAGNDTSSSTSSSQTVKPSQSSQSSSNAKAEVEAKAKAEAEAAARAQAEAAARAQAEAAARAQAEAAARAQAEAEARAKAEAEAKAKAEAEAAAAAAAAQQAQYDAAYDQQLQAILNSLNIYAYDERMKMHQITDYVASHFHYRWDVSPSNGKTMLAYGGGTCYGYSELLRDLATKAGVNVQYIGKAVGNPGPSLWNGQGSDHRYIQVNFSDGSVGYCDAGVRSFEHTAKAFFPNLRGYEDSRYEIVKAMMIEGVKNGTYTPIRSCDLHEDIVYGSGFSNEPMYVEDWTGGWKVGYIIDYYSDGYNPEDPNFLGVSERVIPPDGWAKTGTRVLNDDYTMTVSLYYGF